MASTQPILPDDRLMVELVSKKLGLLIVDTLGLGVSGCRFGIPKPQEFLAKRQAQLHALAVTLRCVIVSPDSGGEFVSALDTSAARVQSLLAELLQDISALSDWKNQHASFVQKVVDHLSEHIHLLLEAIDGHLRLVGSRVAMSPELVARCEAIVRALPAEFGQEKTAV
jgi:hypothetical protein